MWASEGDSQADVPVLVLMVDLDVPHFIDQELVSRREDGSIRWHRRNRDVERKYIADRRISYQCVGLPEDEKQAERELRAILDPQSDPGYQSVMVVYGKHPDLSNSLVRSVAIARGGASGLALIRFYCCGQSNPHVGDGWAGASSCSLPRPGDLSYHLQHSQGRGFTVEEDLAYYVSHALQQPGKTPEVAVGALLVADGGDFRFFLAERLSGGAKGTFGTIGGPFIRGLTFMASLKQHAKERLLLSERIVEGFQAGPVLACTNMIGNLDHAIDITFLVTAPEAFIAGRSRHAGESGWYTFEEMHAIYERSIGAPGVGLFAPGGEKVLFAPVRNAFEGYCLLLLAGAVGETLLPAGIARGIDRSISAQMDADRRRRKAWLRLASGVHERIMDTSPFLYDQRG